jgi:hypothetical protein
MNDKTKKSLLTKINEAMNRFTNKTLGLQQAYIIILTASLSGNKGHGELKDAIKKLENTLKSDNLNTAQYFLSILFLDYVSEIEIFFSNIIKAVISEFPKKLGSASFKLSEILDSSSNDELITKAADEFIYKLMYKKPYEYLEEICNHISINKKEVIPIWHYYIEAKARRDLGVHNNWKCNSTYLRKLKEANIVSKAKIGDSLAPDYDNYVKILLEQLLNLVAVFTIEMKKEYA